MDTGLTKRWVSCFASQLEVLPCMNSSWAVSSQGRMQCIAEASIMLIEAVHISRHTAIHSSRHMPSQQFSALLASCISFLTVVLGRVVNSNRALIADASALYFSFVLYAAKATSDGRHQQRLPMWLCCARWWQVVSGYCHVKR